MTKREFVAYKFGEISKEDFMSEEFIWAPVLFPYHPARDFYFITLSVSGGKGCFAPEERKALIEIPRSDDFVIDSLYDACGYNPLFLIAEAKSPSNIKNEITGYHKGYHTYPRYMSIATPAEIIKRFGVNSNDFPKIEDEIKNNPNLLKELEKGIKGIKDIIGEKFTKEEVKKFIKEVNRTFEDIPTRVWNKFVRFVPMNMDKVISVILIQPPDKKTEDEIVKEIEKDERIIDAYKVMGESRLLIKIITDGINEVFSYKESLTKSKIHTLSRIVFCTLQENGFSFSEHKTPKLKSALSSPIQMDILRCLWKNAGLDRRRQINAFLAEYPEYSDRAPAEWESKFEEVEDQFVYKYSTKLHRDGWFKTLLFIKSSLDGKQIVWEAITSNLLDVDTSYFSRKHYVVTGDFDFIVPMDFSTLNSLDIKIDKFLTAKVGDKKEDKEVNEYVTDIRIYFESSDKPPEVGLEKHETAAIKAMMPNSKVSDCVEGTPRNEYYKYYLENRKDKGQTLEEILTLAKAKHTIELHTEELVHAFVRFRIRDQEEFDKTLRTLSKDRNHIFLYREYKPVHNRGSKMFILATENFKSLFHFISSFGKCCRETLTSLISIQDFFRPEIHHELRCKPCRLPLGEKCDACPQYIVPRNRTNIRDVDLKIKEIKPCKVAVVQLNLGENVDILTPWYNGHDKDNRVNAITDNVISRLDEAIKENADIVVFPEMSIPEGLIEKIKEKIKQVENIIVIAGTHLHQYSNAVAGEKTKYYNTCPVLISNGEEVMQYDVHKNSKSPDVEEELERKYGEQYNMEIKEGVGMLRFTNTGFGNFSILICYDILEKDMRNALSKEIDFLIVPSWNSNHKNLEEGILFANGERWFTIVANNGCFGKSGLYAPYKGEVLEKLEQERPDKGEGGITYYPFNLLSEEVNVFISYSKVDGEDLANKLKESLERLSIKISAFVAHDDIDIGVPWETAIITALRDCDVFIPILTLAACLSNWVQKEIELAIENETRIIPYRYKEVSPNTIPDSIKNLQLDTFTNENELIRKVFTSLDLG